MYRIIHTVRRHVGSRYSQLNLLSDALLHVGVIVGKRADASCYVLGHNFELNIVVKSTDYVLGHRFESWLVQLLVTKTVTFTSLLAAIHIH